MNDEALRGRVMEKESAEVVEIAKELGFDMTVEELEEAMKALRQAAMPRPRRVRHLRPAPIRSPLLRPRPRQEQPRRRRPTALLRPAPSAAM